MLSLEDLFTSANAFGITTASPTQRAICRAIEGRPLGDLAEHEDVLRAFGGSGDDAAKRAAIAALPSTPPTEVDILSAIRGGKTRVACASAFRATQTVDVRGLATGEVPTYSIMSLRVKGAGESFEQLAGTVLARPAMKALLLEEPAGDTLLVRHPSGRPIRIACVAGARAGAGLVGTWSAGVFFDEFTRMVGSDDGAVVNYDDARRAVLGRLLPGAQIISCGSPWAPFGPAYERCQQHWGKPSAEIVVVRGTGPMMNPSKWTPAECERIRKADPITYQTDVLGEFADPETSFITSSEVRAARRAAPLELAPTLTGNRMYVAAIDPGTRGNSWPLVVLGGYRDKENVVRFEVTLARQWTGSSTSPLSPAAVWRQIADILRPYGIRRVLSDQHSADANRDLAARVGLELFIVTVGAGESRRADGRRDAHMNRNEMFETLKGALAQGTLQTSPDPVFERDLLSVRRRVTQSGVTYVLPKTSDGRHADYVPALCLALSAFPDTAETRAAEARNIKLRNLAYSYAFHGLSDMSREEALWHARGGKSLWTALAEAREAEEAEAKRGLINPQLLAELTS